MNKESEIDIFGNLVWLGEVEKVKKMIDSGVDVNGIKSNGMTPLILAVEGDQPQILELLLQNGANPNQQTALGGETALHIAVDLAFDGMVQNNRKNPYPEPLECIKILLKYGADRKIKNNLGKTPLDFQTTEEIRNLFK